MGEDGSAWRAMKIGLEPFFQDFRADCPYGLDREAVYHQGFTGRLPDELLGCFLEDGYRRNGNYLYAMRCPGCRACVPIRLAPRAFRPNRNQRRVWKNNQDVTVEIGPVEVSDEKLSLCEAFLAQRYPGKNNRARDYYSGFFLNSTTSTVEFRYRVGQHLIGVAIVDLADSWLNAVYFYFDPAVDRRSPGTYNILALIEFCRARAIPWFYLGYWIDGVKAMSYKVRFKPHYLRQEAGWVCAAR